MQTTKSLRRESLSLVYQIPDCTHYQVTAEPLVFQCDLDSSVSTLPATISLLVHPDRKTPFNVPLHHHFFDFPYIVHTSLYNKFGYSLKMEMDAAAVLLLVSVQ